MRTMVAGEDGVGEGGRAKLDIFDGTDPSTYRQWKRRAQLMLASLPSTISDKKFGPKLMGFITGEAEALLESLPVEKIWQEKGEEEIWKLLDEKYLPQTIDLLQESMKLFFQELQVKPGESYKQFLVRFDHAQRKLESLEVKLPSTVLGYTLLKKLRLDTNGESMILTTTGGKLEISDVVKAVKSVFPEGKGASKVTKDVFTAEVEVEDDQHDLQCALDVLAAEVQGKDGEDEEILEAFESYVEVRKKIQEQKKGRGYFPTPPRGSASGSASAWRLSGSINGGIEQLKQKSRCYICNRFGHWKRECPVKKQKETSASSSTTTRSKEAFLVEDEDADVQRLWEVFQVENEQRASKTVTWGSSMENDVRNTGFADTHSTGNRQRPWKSSVSQGHGQEGLGSGEEHQCEVCVKFEVFHGESVLSAGAKVSEDSLAICGVPDTACRKTLVTSGRTHSWED